MKTVNGMMAALAAGALLAGLAGAEVSAVSSEALLDTRSFTTDWSAAQRLNTKKIVGTMIVVR